MAGILVQGAILAVVLPIGVLLLHEITHYGAARVTGSAQLEVATVVPPRLRLTYDVESVTTARLVALAPTIVGILVVPGAIVSGLWRWIVAVEPYYMEIVVGAYWALYTLPSPADLRAAIWLDNAENKPLYWLRSKLGL